MRRAGRVISETQGVAVLRLRQDEPPSIGARVVNDQLTEVGTVVDVFGPVESPYVAVSPAEEITPTSLLSQILYVR